MEETNTSKDPLVSIICTTYNHEKYIKQALDGFVNQKTNFLFEIIVHDDASTDTTPCILKEYENKYPNLFQNIYREENWYSKGKNIWAFLFNKVAKGKYIALCEGDDYWIDPLKLQKQVDLLNSNDSASLIFTERIVQTETNYHDKYQKTYYNKNDLLGGLILGVQTICFRKDAISSFYDKYSNSNINGDTLIPYLCSLNGDILCLHEETAVYRKTGFGVATSRNPNENLKISLNHVWNFHSYFGFPSKRLLIKAQTQYILIDMKNNKCINFNGVKLFFEYNKSLVDYFYFFYYLVFIFSKSFLSKMVKLIKKSN